MDEGKDLEFNVEFDEGRKALQAFELCPYICFHTETLEIKVREPSREWIAVPVDFMGKRGWGLGQYSVKIIFSCVKPPLPDNYADKVREILGKYGKIL
ncbi:MAG: hypothetical protein V1837_05225 [Candidatus Woesearchaeota archaeon]